MRNESQGINWLGMVQAVVLMGWATALGWLGHGAGDDRLLGRFLRLDYWWIVSIALWVLLVFLGSLVVRQPHQHGLDRRRSLIHAAILSLPLLFLPLAVNSELSTGAAEKRSLFTSRVAMNRSEAPISTAASSQSGSGSAQHRGVSPGLQVTGKQFQSTTSTKTLLNSKASNEKSGAAMTSGKSHKPTLWDLVSNPEAFTGSDTTIIGMVYKGKRLSSDSFYCYRLLMVCCAADASPEGVIVKWPGTAKLKKGAWVKVQGKVGLTIFEGEDYPTILATMVEKTRPPKNKFIVPR